jgi:hypothetical protein
VVAGADALMVNGTVVWKAAGFVLGDGWGINLAGDGRRIQIVPGMSTDIEVADGYLASGGHIALLPRGEALTYQLRKRRTAGNQPVRAAHCDHAGLPQRPVRVRERRGPRFRPGHP